MKASTIITTMSLALVATFSTAAQAKYPLPNEVITLIRSLPTTQMQRAVEQYAQAIEKRFQVPLGSVQVIQELEAELNKAWTCVKHTFPSLQGATDPRALLQSPRYVLGRVENAIINNSSRQAINSIYENGTSGAGIQNLGNGAASCE